MQSQRGNAMIYILIALALMGALTVVLSRQSEQTDSENLTEEMAQFESAQILAYAQSAQSAVDKMLMSGSTPEDLDFDMPNSGSFSEPPYYNKVYHPEGGGLIYKSSAGNLFDTTIDPVPGYYIGMFNNVTWTPTGAQDIIFTAYAIKKPICEAINEKITGSKTIPAYITGLMRATLIDQQYHPAGQHEFGIDDCNDCEGMAMLCASNNVGTIFSFYAIIVAR
jgi:hypothetical protein